MEAIREQAGKYLHTSFNVTTYEHYIKLCEVLALILPHGEKTKAMLVSIIHPYSKIQLWTASSVMETMKPLTRRVW